MKRYKPLLLQIGILLLIVSIVLFFLGQRKHYVNVDFSKQYSGNKTIELAGFEEGEQWQGDYSYDSERVMEGNSSITLSSWYGKENSIYNVFNTTIPPGYTNGYISVYISNYERLSSLVSFSLSLTGEKEQKKEYKLSSLLRVGWNRIAVVIPSWNRISQISFSAVSKPGTIAEVNIDRFWIENTSAYNPGYFSSPNKSLSLRTIGDRTYLFSASSSSETYSLNNPSILNRGTLTISLIPEHGKEIQLSLNGTSIKIAGKNMNECSLYIRNEKPSSTILKTSSAKDDLFVFVKAEIQNGKILYSLSNNGVNFESCGSGTYSQKQPVQLSLKGSYLIDSYSAEY